MYLPTPTASPKHLAAGPQPPYWAVRLQHVRRRWAPPCISTVFQSPIRHLTSPRLPRQYVAVAAGTLVPASVRRTGGGGQEHRQDVTRLQNIPKSQAMCRHASFSIAIGSMKTYVGSPFDIYRYHLVDFWTERMRRGLVIEPISITQRSLGAFFYIIHATKLNSNSTALGRVRPAVDKAVEMGDCCHLCCRDR